MKKAFFVAAAMTLSSAFAQPFVWPAAWSVDSPKEVKRGGEYRDYQISDYKTFNPFTSAERDSIPDVLSSNTGLFKQDPRNDKFIPYMAQAMPQVSNNGRRFVVKLREGMKWSDGQEITADDWVTTHKIYSDKNVGAGMYSVLRLSDKPITIKKIDKYTLQFDFPQTSARAYSILSYGPWPDHVFGPAYKKGGAEAIKAMWGLNTDPKELVNAGTWSLESYRPGERAVFKANPAWGGWNVDSADQKLPYLDRYSVTIAKDLNAALAAYLAGQTDEGPANSVDQLSQIKKAIDAKQLDATLLPKVSPTAGSTWITFNWNKADEPFKQQLFRDVRFRKAMSHLADRDAMIKLVYGGLGSPSYSSLYPIFEKNYPSKNAKRYEYNIAEAVKLLNSMGFTQKDKEGYLVDKQGRRVEFTLQTNAGNNEREKLIRIFADTAKQAGVKVNTQPVDFNNLVNALLATGDKRPFDAILLSLGGGGNVWPFGSNVIPCSGNLHHWTGAGKCLTAQEQLMEKLYYLGDKELDLDKRKEIGGKLVEVESELVPAVYLLGPAYNVTYNNRLGGGYPKNLVDAYYGDRSLPLTFIKK